VSLAILLLAAASFAIACPLTLVMRTVGVRAAALDTAPLPGQHKERRAVPNTGGVAIYAALVLPLAAAVVGVHALDQSTFAGLTSETLAAHVPGVRSKSGLALALIASLTALHILGLIDDRRPLGPLLKLAVMAVPPLLIASFTDTRLLTVLDDHAGGPWLSIVLTVLWFLAVTNALNFIDNMDGLAAGVASVASLCFLAAAAMSEQWFVAATLALLIGACAGFLVFNRPPASIFMGDSGSLLLGFTLAFLTARTTYTGESPTGEPLAGGWYAVFMPLIVLAVPLYDMTTVSLIRLRQGRSPMVGDMQHLSHRLVKRGLSKPAAVGVICGMTAATGIAGIALGSLEPWQAMLVGVQTALLLLVLAAFEFASSPAVNGGDDGDA
jgi:UDP-GlcNAc:undecaprenyl-phosphate GlcNAc-1-phosphate transferase